MNKWGVFVTLFKNAFETQFLKSQLVLTYKCIKISVFLR